MEPTQETVVEVEQAPVQPQRDAVTVFVNEPEPPATAPSLPIVAPTLPALPGQAGATQQQQQSDDGVVDMKRLIDSTYGPRVLKLNCDNFRYLSRNVDVDTMVARAMQQLAAAPDTILTNIKKIEVCSHALNHGEELLQIVRKCRDVPTLSAAVESYQERDSKARVTVMHMDTICSMLDCFTDLKELLLHGTFRDEDVATILAGICPRIPSTLTKLTLGSNALDTSCMAPICALLQRSPALEVLDVSSISRGHPDQQLLKEADVVMIFDALSGIQSLQRLEIIGFNFTTESSVEALLSMVDKHEQLESLKLSDKALSVRDCARLLKAAKRPLETNLTRTYADARDAAYEKSYYDKTKVQFDPKDIIIPPVSSKVIWARARPVPNLTKFAKLQLAISALVSTSDPFLDVSVIITTYAANGDWGWAGVSIAILVCSTLLSCYECYKERRPDLIPWQFFSLSAFYEMMATAITGKFWVNITARMTSVCTGGPAAIEHLAAHEAVYEGLPQLCLQLYVATVQGFTPLLLVSLLGSLIGLVKTIAMSDTTQMLSNERGSTVMGYDLMANPVYVYGMPYQQCFDPCRRFSFMITSCFALFRLLDIASQLLVWILLTAAFRVWVLIPLSIGWTVCVWRVYASAKKSMNPLLFPFEALRLLLIHPVTTALAPSWTDKRYSAREIWDWTAHILSCFRTILYAVSIPILWSVDPVVPVSAQFVPLLIAATVIGGAGQLPWLCVLGCHIKDDDSPFPPKKKLLAIARADADDSDSDDE